MTAPVDAEEPLDSALGWVAHHTQRYVESGGDEGHDWNGVPCLVLTTRGRRSGRLRRNALIYGRDGDTYVVVASYGVRVEREACVKPLHRTPRSRDRPRTRA